MIFSLVLAINYDSVFAEHMNSHHDSDSTEQPAESPYREFEVTPDIDLYLETHNVLQTFGFTVIISGHTELLATKKTCWDKPNICTKRNGQCSERTRF